MTALAQLLKDKLKAAGLTVTKAAKQARISFPSFHSALSGKSAPNQRSVDKYAKFLGISAEQVFAAAPRSRKSASAAKSGRKAKRTGTARRGRPPGAKNKLKKGAAGQVKALSASLKQAVVLLKRITKGLRALK